MILRRLADAIRSQNWFTVIIEILIVVTGIFVGLQVDDWNQQRQKTQREQQTIARMHAEAENVVQYFIDRIDNQILYIYSADAFVKALTSGDSFGLTEEIITKGFKGLILYPAIAPPRAAYNELSDNGLLNEISDIDIRESMAEYYRQLDFMQGQIDRFRETGLSDLGVEEGIRYIYDPSSTMRMRFEVDFERLSSNPSFVSISVKELRDQIRFTQYYLLVLQKAEAMCISLAESSDDTCPDTGPVMQRYRKFNP